MPLWETRQTHLFNASESLGDHCFSSERDVAQMVVKPRRLGPHAVA